MVLMQCCRPAGVAIAIKQHQYIWHTLALYKLQCSDDALGLTIRTFMVHIIKHLGFGN